MKNGFIKAFALLIIASSVGILSSCKPSTHESVDYSKVYIGSFPTVTNAVTGKVLNHWLYASVLSEDQIVNGYEFDYEYDLSNSSYSSPYPGKSATDDKGHKPWFVNLSDVFAKHGFKNPKDFFDHNGWVSVFTSIGRFSDNESERFVSQRFSFGKSGFYYSFSVIQKNGDKLGVSRARVLNGGQVGGLDNDQ